MRLWTLYLTRFPLLWFLVRSAPMLPYKEHPQRNPYRQNKKDEKLLHLTVVIMKPPADLFGPISIKPVFTPIVHVPIIVLSDIVAPNVNDYCHILEEANALGGGG